MKRSAGKLAALVICLIAVSSSARADQIVVPPLVGASGSCWPFGCSTHIQTIFDAALFPSAIRIDSLTLFNTTEQSAEFGAEPATYKFSLSTTRTSSQTIGPDMAANVGGNSRLVAEWSISDPTFFTTLTLPFEHAFVFTPFAGNLLLDIRKDRTANEGDGPIYANVNTNAAGVATVIDALDNGLPSLQRNVALNVGFGGQRFGPAFDPSTPTATPEPGSLLLLASGAAALFVRKRQK